MNRISAKQFYDEIRGSCSLSYELSELNFAGQHIDLNDSIDEELKMFDIFNFREIYSENLKTKMLDCSEMRNLNENIDVFIKLLRKLKSLQYLIIDHTNLTFNSLCKVLKVCNSLNNLSYISAIMEDNELNRIQFVDLKFYSDKICRILKNNVCILYLALIEDENKENDLCPDIKKELNKNLQCVFHKHEERIPINHIKSVMSYSEHNLDIDEPLIDDHLLTIIGRTLVLSDDLFIKENTDDFIYYLSLDKHSIRCIDATRVSNSKLNKLFKLMLNNGIILTTVRRIDFGTRSMSSSEFALLCKMIVLKFSKTNEAVDFYWKDIGRILPRSSPNTEAVLNEREIILDRFSKSNCCKLFNFITKINIPILCFVYQ